MSSVYDKYEAVIGLEVHTQMLTKSKAYSSDINEYGGLPNTHVSAVSLGHPGTLPVMNEKTIEFAVRLGIALECDIAPTMYFARKNYFYPDLPKGYQITQDKTPVCTKGHIDIKDDDGKPKRINLTRIHMEEDAGKSLHDVDPFHTLVDLNRAGVPLLEIVSEPDIRTGKEAYNYLTEIRKLVRYLGICDGNMEEGSMRCDANISVRLKGSTTFGTKIEVKNMNSIRNVQRAIEYEIKRQVDAIENGEKLYMETRNFDAVSGTTSGMRSKEGSSDYRYFPEPDLQPLLVTEEYKATVKKNLPPLPQQLVNKYMKDFGLSEYDALQITDTKEFALYFEELTTHTTNYKAAANWMMSVVRMYLNENAMDITQFAIKPSALAKLIAIIDDGKVSHTAASQHIFPELANNPGTNPLDIAVAKNLVQESNEDALLELVKQALAKYPEKVVEYRAGKTGLAGLFMGEVMKLSGGKADPKATSKLLNELLNK
ncbi:MAG TPA: Asp-tRNA(Asn)/Glu-tRNA(Gln) amidotransferase subunit GatB [Flavobacteriales bacterium]|nr:Asp-tRNA(Asn)/Glu-tRNA(Gln) amidotransferase subunit GatB [Flavobacteriales bacterium]